MNLLEQVPNQHIGKKNIGVIAQNILSGIATIGIASTAIGLVRTQEDGETSRSYLRPTQPVYF